MKIRTGFVSNSSSSSFICQLCGRQESGWDASYEEFGYVECPNGHVICDEEAYEFDDPNNEYGSGEIPECACPICLFEVSSKSDMKKYLQIKYKVSEIDVFVEVKKQNGRRKKLYDIEYVNYVYNKFDIQEQELLKSLKTEFVEYSFFLEYLRKNN